MGTNKQGEQALVVAYPNSLRHLQQLIMDLETCAKNIGKKTLFGNDKFKPAEQKILETLKSCAIGLALDGYLSQDYGKVSMGQVLATVNTALNEFRLVYGNWPLAFYFWDVWYEQQNSIVNNNIPLKQYDDTKSFVLDPTPVSNNIFYWYESEFGIGNKLTKLFLYSHEIQRTDSPSLGYKVLHTHPREQGQSVPSFVSDTEIEKPLVSRGQLESTCPKCGVMCSAQADALSYFSCGKCKHNWWQRL